MPFALDNAQDVYGRITALQRVFAGRDALLRDCEPYLTIHPIVYNRNPKERVVQIDDAKGEIQVQAHWATVRVHVPWLAKLPVPYDLPAADRERLENTEILAAGLLQEAFNRTGHAADFDIASYIVHRGASAGYLYWSQPPGADSKDQRPCCEVFDPANVRFEDDEWGPIFYAVRSTLPEGELATWLDGKRLESPGVGLWLHSYDRTSTAARSFWRVWARDRDGTILKGVVGDPNGRNPDRAQDLMPLAPDDVFHEMPVWYRPAGGRAALTPNVGADHAYGAPFYADMRADVDTMTHLSDEEFLTIMSLASAPTLTLSASGDVHLNQLPGADNTGTPDVQHHVLNISSPGALPALQAAYELRRQRIERKGLSYLALGQGNPPRSDVLRRGMELAALQTLQPYVQAFSETHRILNNLVIAQAHTRLARGEAPTIMRQNRKGKTVAVPAIRVSGPSKKMGPGEPKRTTYWFAEDDLYWDGEFEIVLTPPRTAETNAQALQSAQIKKQFFSDAIPTSVILEDDLGYEQPAKMAIQARQESLAAAMKPALGLVDISIAAGRLQKIESRYRLMGAFTQDDADFIAGLVSLSQLHLDSSEITLETIQILREFADRVAQDLRQRLIPQAQAQARSEGANGGAPPPNATMNPGLVPSQGSIGANGYTGSGGTEDMGARMVKAAGGSDQMRNNGTGGM